MNLGLKCQTDVCSFRCGWALQVRCRQSDAIGRRCLWTGRKADFARHRHQYDVNNSSIMVTPGSSVDNQPGSSAASSRKRPAEPADVDLTPKQKRQNRRAAAAVGAGLVVFATAAAAAAGYKDKDAAAAFANALAAAVPADDEQDDHDDDDDDNNYRPTVAVCEKVLRVVRDAARECARVADADLQTLADEIHVETNQEAEMYTDFVFAASRQLIAVAEHRASLIVPAAAAVDADDDDDDDDAIRYAHLNVKDTLTVLKETVSAAVNEANAYVDALDAYRKAVRADPASPAAIDATEDAEDAETKYEDAVESAERVLALAKLVIAATVTTTPAAAADDDDGDDNDGPRH